MEEGAPQKRSGMGPEEMEEGDDGKGRPSRRYGGRAVDSEIERRKTLYRRVRAQLY